MKNKEQWEKTFEKLFSIDKEWMFGNAVYEEMIDFIRSTIQAEREKTVQEIKDSMGFVVCVDPEAHEPENSELRKLKLAKIIQAEKEALLEKIIEPTKDRGPTMDDQKDTITALAIAENVFAALLELEGNNED